MIKTRDMWRMTACAALLGCTALVSSCTTSSISTVGTTPSFAPTAILDSVSEDGATSGEERLAIAQGEQTQAMPQTATTNIEAPENIAAFTGDAITTQTVASKPVVEPLTPADVLATTEVKTAAQADTTSIAPTSNDVPVIVPEAVANKTAEPTGVFAFLKRSNEKRIEDAAAKKEAAEAAASKKSTRLAAAKAKAAPKKQVAEMRALPGVRASSLFGITKSTADTEEPVQLASAAIGAGTSSVKNGIATQTPNVNVGCFRPELVKAIKKIERHYGKKVIVTSGYRSPKKNRRAGGSKKSLHMYCAAADVQVEGVSKWALAKYIRSMPGRGGVGTYCHTKSVHLDIGSKRDWNWRCRRK